MTKLEQYTYLFSDDGFIPHDQFPINTDTYKLQRELASINLVGITYDKEYDKYLTRVPIPKDNYTYYKTVLHDNIIDAIIAYDDIIDKYKLDTPKYVVNGKRQFTKARSKYFDTNARQFIDKYKDKITQGELARLLQIPTKEVNKYMTRVYKEELPKPNTITTVVVWDVRDKYEQVLNNIQDNSISTSDIDILLGLE